MPIKLPPLDVDHACELYMSGLTTKQVADEMGVSTGFMYKSLKKAGVRLTDLRPVEYTRPRSNRITLDRNLLLRLKSRYEAGETKTSIAESIGVHINVLIRELERVGVKRAATRSEAVETFMQRKTADERREQLAAAWEARRGSTDSLAVKRKRAKTRERRGLGISDYEVTLADWLREAGREVVMQKAVGPYNVDLAVESVAVEVFGGHWHATGRHRARLRKRTEHLLRSGWNLYILWIHPAHHPLTRNVTSDLIAFIDEAGSDPSPASQYRVVWGNGQFIASGCADDDDLALVPSAERSDYAVRAD